MVTVGSPSDGKLEMVVDAVVTVAIDVVRSDAVVAVVDADWVVVAAAVVKYN